MVEANTEQTWRIGHVARVTGVKTSVLRYWENEFEQLTPARTEKGQRIYTHEHIALLHTIKALLYTDGLTIKEARHRLENAAAPKAAPSSPAPAETPTAQQVKQLKQEVCEELQALRKMLD